MKTLSKIIIFFFLFLGVLGVSTAYGNQPSYNPSPTAPLENDKSEDAQPENDEEDFEDDDKTGYIWHVWKHRFYNLCTIFESIYQISRFINFILFLRVGEFRSLVERILQMR